MKGFLNAIRSALVLAVLGCALAACEEPTLAIPEEAEEANGGQPPGTVGLEAEGQDDGENEAEDED